MYSSDIICIASVPIVSVAFPSLVPSAQIRDTCARSSRVKSLLSKRQAPHSPDIGLLCPPHIQPAQLIPMPVRSVTARSNICRNKSLSAAGSSIIWQLAACNVSHSPDERLPNPTVSPVPPELLFLDGQPETGPFSLVHSHVISHTSLRISTAKSVHDDAGSNSWL